MHNLSPSLGVHSRVVRHQVGVVQYLVDIPESSVWLDPIALLALVVVHPVEALPTLPTFQLMVRVKQP